MAQRKTLLKLEDVEYFAEQTKPHEKIVITQQRDDGTAEHPVGSYDPKSNKFTWDKQSVEDRREELETLVLKKYG